MSFYKAERKDSMKNNKRSGKAKNLIIQGDKIMNKSRRGSIGTRRKYTATNRRFLNYVADKFGVQSVRNIEDKHVSSYLIHLREKGSGPSYLKTEFSGIKYLHEHIPNPRYKELTLHGGLDIEDRVYGEKDRKFSERELRRFFDVCEEYKREDIRDMGKIALHVGTRISEVVTLQKSQLEEALREDELYIKGKGGRERYIPLNEEIKEVIERLNDSTDRGYRVFIEEDQKTHEAIKSVQNFMNRHREKYEDEALREEKGCNLSFHSFRHSYATNEYENRIAKGYDQYTAEKEVSQLLGHNRPEITRIYLAK